MKPIPFLLVLAEVGLAAPLPDASRKELDALQGIWIVEKCESGVGGPSGKGDVMTIRGDRLEWKCPPASGMTYRLRIKSGTVDLIPESGTQKGEVQEGIYQLDGDTLRICHCISERQDAEPKYIRPTKFEAPKGTYHIRLFTLKRKKENP